MRLNMAQPSDFAKAARALRCTRRPDFNTARQMSTRTTNSSARLARRGGLAAAPQLRSVATWLLQAALLVVCRVVTLIAPTPPMRDLCASKLAEIGPAMAAALGVGPGTLAALDDGCSGCDPTNVPETSHRNAARLDAYPSLFDPRIPPFRPSSHPLPPPTGIG